MMFFPQVVADVILSVQMVVAVYGLSLGDAQAIPGKEHYRSTTGSVIYSETVRELLDISAAAKVDGGKLTLTDRGRYFFSELWKGAVRDLLGSSADEIGRDG